MNTKVIIAGLCCVCVAAMTLVMCPAARAEDVAAAQAARRILSDTGITGGLIVHLGCGDGKLTAALKAGDSFLVHGLDRSAEKVAAARQYLHEAGVYGPVAVDVLKGEALPYIDNMVNLIVVENTAPISRAEIMRVLCPNGIAFIRQGNKWTKIVKPQPKDTDDWTHYLHDSSNNAVSHDITISPPRHLQWVGSPRYSRHHDHMSGASAMVSADGRIYYIFDHANPLSVQLPSKWLLVGRDAFNGTILWRRAIKTWHTQMFKLKSGPIQLTRRLVAADDLVYVTLGLEAPVTAVDGATGRTLKTYPQTEKTEEIIYNDGTLFVQVNDSPFRQPALPSELNYDFVEGPRRIIAVDAAGGKTLWEVSSDNVLPLTLTADDKRVLFCDGEKVVCLDRKKGKKLWESEQVARRKVVSTFFAPTVVIYGEVVLFSGGSNKPDERNRGGGNNTMYAFSVETGKTLWKADHPASGYKSPEDILVVGGLVWTPETTVGSDSGIMIGREPTTGKIRKQFAPDVETHWFHHRCYRAKATDKYLLTSRTGIEFVDPETEHWLCHHWVRGACLYGIMPANGMIYNPPHPCACYLEAKLYGFNALAGASESRQVPRKVPLKGRLECGPAFGKVKTAAQSAADWPTYRCDAERSGYTKASGPEELGHKWKSRIDGRLSSVVVAEGRVFVASVDTHRVYALHADSGKVAWSYVAGGRVDSPPTVWKGRVLFGSADGHVYCLRASDGALVWRFRAAPVDRRMCSFEQLESVWPVHGSVLIREGELWCVAGRSMFIDGGLRLLRLDPVDGRLIDERIMDDKVPGSKDNLQVLIKTLNMPVALADILSADDKYVYMRSQRFDFTGTRHELEVPTLDVSAQRGEGPHLFSPTGFLDDIWWHRSYWVYGRVWKSGAGGYSQAGRVAPAGRPMVFNNTTVYGFGRKPQFYRWTTPMEYQLFATSKQPKSLSTSTNRPARQGRAGQRTAARRKRTSPTRTAAKRIEFDWTEEVPILVRAMVLAGETLFIAGAPDVLDEEQSLKTFDQPRTQKQLARQVAAYDGSEGAILWAVSAVDGKKLAARKLESMPVFDGMAAAGGRLYMATTDGHVLSFEDQQ